MLPSLEIDLRTTLLFLGRDAPDAAGTGAPGAFPHEVLKRVDPSRFRVIHISPRRRGAKTDETIDGVRYLRAGGSLSVVFAALEFYRTNSSAIQFVIEQGNSQRYFTRFWVPANKRIFFVHHLNGGAGQFGGSSADNPLGTWTEGPWLRLFRHDNTVTISNSTRNDLIAAGFEPEKVAVVREGIDFAHWKIEEFRPKSREPIFLYMGRFAAHKGLDETVEAFGKFRQETGTGTLQIVGKANEDYVLARLAPLMNRYGLSCGYSGEHTDITLRGFVSDGEKLELMSGATALVCPFRREGSGLLVTEAAAVGTPSIAYWAPGIVDAVDCGRAGYLTTENTTEGLLVCMREISRDPEGYKRMRRKAYEYSLRFHQDYTANAFEAYVDHLLISSELAEPNCFRVQTQA